MDDTYTPLSVAQRIEKNLIGRDFQDPLLKLRPSSVRASERIVWLLISITVAFVPFWIALQTAPDGGFGGLSQVPWHVPNWLLFISFGLISLYGAIAAWRMYDLARRARADYFGCYAMQWVLSCLWIVATFWFDSPQLALLVSVALIATLVATIEQFRLHSVAAARMMLPALYASLPIAATSLITVVQTSGETLLF